MVNYIRKVFLFVISFILFTELLMSQTTLFKVQYNNSEYTDKPFTIVYQYMGKHMPKKFGDADFADDLKVIYKADNVSNTNINGQIQMTVSRTYTIIAEKPGRYKIPSLSIVDENGETKSAGGKYINIIKGAKKQNDRGKTSKNGNNIILASVFNKKSVYIYEPIYMLLKLFYESDGVRPNFDKYPTIENFLLEPFTDDQNMGLLGVEKLNGKNYKTISFGNSIIMPTKSGKLSIDPISINVSITQEPEDAASFFLSGSRVINELYSSQPVSIDVKPIPENGRPDSFFGLVGNFEAKLYVDKNELGVGDAVTVKLRINGTGYLKPIDIPSPSFPDGFDIYDPKVNYLQSVDADGIHCSKEVEYVIIPNSVGSYEIPPVLISFFDPKTASFKTIKTDSIKLNVKKGTNVASAKRSSEVKTYSFVDKLIVSHNNIEKSYSLRNLFIYILAYVFVVIIGYIIYIKILMIRKNKSDVVSFNYSKADSFAKKQLVKANKYVASKDSKNFYEEIMKVLWTYASHKLKTPIGQLNKENIRDKFISIGLNECEIDLFLELLSISEMQRYSFVQVDDNLEDIYNKAISFITLMEGKGK